MNLCKTHYGTLAVGECIACKLYDRITELEQELEDARKHHHYLDETLNELYGERDKLASALEQIKHSTKHAKVGRSHNENNLANIHNMAKQALKGGQVREIVEQALKQD
jgi:chromosome segregation ATPase